MKIAVGKFSVERVVENEGPFAPASFMLPALPEGLIEANREWLEPRYVREGLLVLSFQSFVLRTGRHTILVDACVGNDKERPLRPGWHRARGPFLERLAAAGLRPEDIDFVCCTHLHADHVGWNTRLHDGRWVPTFPNARYVFGRAEYAHWEAEHRAAAARGEAINHGSFADSVLPVVEAGRAELVDDGHEIEKGITLELAPGHTPGGALLHARDAGGHAVFLGDVIHTPVQLADPSVSSRFCEDPARSAATRRAVCERYAETGVRVFPAHFPDPEPRRIVRRGGAFALAD